MRVWILDGAEDSPRPREVSLTFVILLTILDIFCSIINFNSQIKSSPGDLIS